MKSIVSAALFCLPLGALAGAYDDCVLNGMKGVSGDVAARMVAQACRNKVKENQAKQRSSFGEDLDKNEYALRKGSAVNLDGGFMGYDLANLSDAKTITYVELVIKDGDFYDYKRSEPTKPANDAKKPARSRPDDPYDLAGMEARMRDAIAQPAWEEKRTHRYFYRFTIPPGKTVRLKFTSTKTPQFYAEVGTILGRPFKWTDKAAELTNEVSPEAGDPLE